MCSGVAELDQASIMLGLFWDHESARYKFLVPFVPLCTLFA